MEEIFEEGLHEFLTRFIQESAGIGCDHSRILSERGHTLMLLTVDHVTRYHYDQPVRGVVQSHRLTPSVFDGQRVLDWEVTVTDGLMGGGFRDGAGDWVQGWSVQGPVSEIVVTVRGTVETTDLIGVLRGHREFVPPQCYLRETYSTTMDAALVDLAATVQGVGRSAGNGAPTV